MLKVNSEVEIKNLRASKLRNGQPYYTFSVPLFRYDFDRQSLKGTVSILCWGAPIAPEGAKVYIHEIVGFDIRKFRSRAGGWMSIPRIYCTCGTEPLGEVEDDEQDTD